MCPLSLHPSRTSYAQGPPQPLTLTFPLGDLDPFAYYRRLDRTGGPHFLLETGRPAIGQSSYSFFGTEPYATLWMANGRSTWRQRDRAQACTDDPLDSLLHHVTANAVLAHKHLPPFVGGAVGYLSYDFIRSLEQLPTHAKQDAAVPELHIALYDVVGAIDHAEQTLCLLFTPSAERFALTSRDALYDEGAGRLQALHMQLIGAAPRSSPTYDWQAMAPIAGQTRAEYMARVARCQEYIRAGDIYQANLSHRFSFDMSALGQTAASDHAAVGTALYERLRQVNPSPFAGLMAFDDLTIVSSSPERLIRQQGCVIDTRPIAGTRPRGAGAWEDDQLKHELLANEKERAEHVMLVDLERNDLGRVCDYGTVSVDEFFTIEQYSHVSHLVSNVRGTLRPEATGADVLRAVFPGGTITGVPKVRCMQIIDELEPVRRGLYTGSLGYISRTGDMDWNILIRTMLLTGQRGYLQVGAGIVADSDPAREYDETLHKGQAFFSALGVRL